MGLPWNAGAVGDAERDPARAGVGAGARGVRCT
jgi:hypothetical protein